MGGGVICDCVEGFSGESCAEEIVYCASSPCENGATCQELPTSFSCACTAGWTGVTCGVGESLCPFLCLDLFVFSAMKNI